MTAGSRTNRTNNQELMSQREKEYQSFSRNAVPPLNQGSRRGAQAVDPVAATPITLPSPTSGMVRLAPPIDLPILPISLPIDNNIISSFDQIEEARFEVADFKKNLLHLITFFDSLTGSIQALDLTAKLSFKAAEYDSKVSAVKQSLQLIESILEGFALGLTKQLNETHTQNLQIERDRDELSQSLHQIELCYQKNKQKLERDLNKMEYKVKVQGQDAREKMQLRHIKGLDIVESAVKRMMPSADAAGSIELDDQDEETTLEQIKKDLEDVEDVFVANIWSAGMGQVPGGSKAGKDGQGDQTGSP